MAKGKKKKDKKKKEAVGAVDAIIAGDYADAGAEKAAAPQIGPGGKLLIEKILAQGIDAQKTEEVVRCSAAPRVLRRPMIAACGGSGGRDHRMRREDRLASACAVRTSGDQGREN